MATDVASQEFSTSNLFFALWLIARREACQKKKSYRQHTLSFLPGRSTEKLFVFSDPDQQGFELEKEFARTNPVVRVGTLRLALGILQQKSGAR